jgi:hypothetical protein
LNSRAWLNVNVAESGDVFDNQSFNGATFAGFVWIYFFLNVLWVVVSVYGKSAKWRNCD